MFTLQFILIQHLPCSLCSLFSFNTYCVHFAVYFHSTLTVFILQFLFIQDFQLKSTTTLLCSFCSLFSFNTAVFILQFIFIQDFQLKSTTVNQSSHFIGPFEITVSHPSKPNEANPKLKQFGIEYLGETHEVTNSPILLLSIEGFNNYISELKLNDVPYSFRALFTWIWFCSTFPLFNSSLLGTGILKRRQSRQSTMKTHNKHLLV